MLSQDKPLPVNVHMRFMHETHKYINNYAGWNVFTRHVFVIYKTSMVTVRFSSKRRASDLACH
jgi:hypothetical protein